MTYRYEDFQIESFPKFIYEVCVYKLNENGFNIIDSKFISSDEFIENKIVYNNSISKELILLGAPQSFIEEHNLPIYELKKKKNVKRKN